MVEDWQRKEKVVAFFNAVESEEIKRDKGRNQVYFDKEGLRFSLEILSNEGRTVNAAEGGILVGSGENAEIIHHLPVKVDSYRAVLRVRDISSGLEIESYDELGDELPNTNWVRDGKPVSYSPLFELFRRVENKIESYSQKIKEQTERDKIARGKSKLDEILRQHRA